MSGKEKREGDRSPEQREEKSFAFKGKISWARFQG